MCGLGKMGANMATRLIQAGHEVVAFDISPTSVTAAASLGAIPAHSAEHLVEQLQPPRAVWLMVPAGHITNEAIETFGSLLESGDVIVDGGNSRYTDTIERAMTVADRGIELVDAGTSGGIWGLEEGFCLMVGGSKEAFAQLEPIFAALAPPEGYAHVGPSGSGHFTKMVHNGVEYALMQAYAEGFELLRSSGLELDLAQVSELWRHGSVVRSWLLDLAASALADDPELTSVADYVEDSGEGRWTLETAIENAVPTPTIALSLFARFASRQDESFSAKLLAALRREFGGHAVHSTDEDRKE